MKCELCHEKANLKIFVVDTDFSEIDSADIIDYILEKQGPANPFFGMTQTLKYNL